MFSLCGLNCGLCPRYNTNGISRCPGCGGSDFHLKHPTCAVITCNKKHNNVDYCYQCSCYPCDKYSIPLNKDSFISYKNVIKDFEKAEKNGLDNYKAELNVKMNFLAYLLDQYNDGQRKNYYCNALNLLSIEDIRETMTYINTEISMQNITQKEKIKAIILLFEEKALRSDIELVLRK